MVEIDLVVFGNCESRQAERFGVKGLVIMIKFGEEVVCFGNGRS